MSLLSHQLQTKRYQRELKIDTRTFNVLERKHGTINLLKQLKLQLLNPKLVEPAPVSAPAVAGNTGWYGNIFLELLSLRTNGMETTYNYTIYKGSTDQTPVLVSNQTLSNNNYNTVIGSSAHVLTSADRLENNSSSFLVTINSFSGGNIAFVSIQNGTLLYDPDRVQPSVIGTDVRIRFLIEPE